MMPPLSPSAPGRREVIGQGQKQYGGLPGTNPGAAPKSEQISDQANNLRQLVRAHRQWRELTEQPVLKPIARQGCFIDDEECQQVRRETSLAGFAVLLARTFDWARAWRLRRAGGKRNPA